MRLQQIASEGASAFFIGMQYPVQEPHKPHQPLMVRFGGCSRVARLRASA
jgi:hypothetical protein